ncbi:hypothetical protein L207DRAFT_639189 [Hyaloscypha variabilis F]|uniref:2EXR domain-containing protein n=1 Tax=Hyaloscypha variabilis (strain UAMH 11265 / GT02V1 / F) TaxID=1149755 RepID=A0A2J6R5J9_HYAVF|nr:hypothetical protein L207DRAFT_639189 [Hyaloscypha variabilis F]
MAATLAGASRRVLEIPVTTVALSATSLVHLRSARAGSNIEQSHAFSNASKTIDKDRDHEMQESSEESGDGELTEFALFLELPLEIQEEIWKYCTLLHPRIVELQSFLLPDSVRNSQAVTLSQVNHHTRVLTYGLHGYVDLKLRKYNRPVVFNPKIDILYLSHKTLVDDDWNKDKVKRCLEKAGALDKVRCVALFCRRTAFPTWATLLRRFKSLEVLFLVLEQLYLLDGRTNEHLRREFKFEDIELHEWSTRRWCEEFGLLEFYRQHLQEPLARGRERIAPKVVLVKEIWNLPPGCNSWTASFQ